MMTHEEKIREWKCQAERCVHDGWEMEIFRLRVALEGCVNVIQESANTFGMTNNKPMQKFCSSAAQIARETLDWK
jgi:hypothetical protein